MIPLPELLFFSMTENFQKEIYDYLPPSLIYLHVVLNKFDKMDLNDFPNLIYLNLSLFRLDQYQGQIKNLRDDLIIMIERYVEI